MRFRIILKIYIYFIGFVSSIIIFISIFLIILSYLHLTKHYLFFVLEAIINDNKINYKDNSKIKIVAK